MAGSLGEGRVSQAERFAGRTNGPTFNVQSTATSCDRIVGEGVVSQIRQGRRRRRLLTDVPGFRPSPTHLFRRYVGRGRTPALSSTDAIATRQRESFYDG